MTFPTERSCRLLYLLGSLRCGGQERQLHYLLRGLDRGLYPASVVVWNLGEDDFYLGPLKELGVPVISLEARTRLGKLLQWRRLVTRLSPEVIHSYAFYTNVAAQWGAGNGRVILGSIRISFDQSLADNGWVGTLSARWPRQHISNSYAACAEVERTDGFFRPREIYVVPNAVDLAFFSVKPWPAAERVRMLGVGSLLPLKRWDLVLEAMSLLRGESLTPLLSIAGAGPELDRLQDAAARRGLMDQVTFLGRRTDLPELFEQSHFLVHASDSEGMPNVVAEAMASGRAVVATDAGDVPRMIEPGQTGWVVPRRDVPALAGAMRRLILNLDECRRMGLAAREKVERRYPIGLLSERTLAAYEQAGWRNN